MAQKYQITTPDGKVYEIEKPDQGMGVGEGLVEGVKGFGLEGLGQGKDLLSMAGKGGANPAESYGGAVGDVIARTAKELAHRVPGLVTAIKAHPAALLTLSPEKVALDAFQKANPAVGALDPSGASQVLAHKDESTPRKVGRGLFLAAEALAPIGAAKIAGRAGKAAEVAKLAEAAKTGTAGEITAAVEGGWAPFMPTTATPMEGPIKPPATQFTLGWPSVPPAAQASGAGAGTVGPLKPGSIFSLRPTGSVPLQMTEGLVPDVTAANGAHKAEAAAEAAQAGRAEPPGRAPVYTGTDRRSPSRVSGAAEDRAYQDVRKRIEAKNALARAKAMLITKAEGKSSTPLMAETDVPPAIKSSAEPPPVGATKGVLEGFTKQPTKSLAQMVEQYGREGAAQRSAMSVDELDARLEAGDDAAKLAKLLRDRLGAEKAGRALGMKPEEVRKIAGGGSVLPTKAVEGIKATAAREQAETGSVSPQTQALLDRIKSERGGANVKGLIIGGGATAGGVAGSLAPAKNSDDRIGNTILGALGGGGLAAGGSMLGGRKAAEALLALRREAFLTGGAIPKNVLTAAGAPVRAAFENTSATSRMAPVKEMLDLPTNAKNFWQHFRMDPIKQYPNQVHLGKWAPSKMIGAIDDTARDALKRGGLDQDTIDRYLLTKDRNFFNLKDYAKGEKPTPVFSPQGKEVINTLVPFQRVPTNVLVEGINEIGHTLSHVDKRALFNALQAGGSYGAGKWAGNDPKRQYIVSVLLAATGPNAMMSTMAASAGAGISGFGAGRLGGISPVPEQAFDPKSFLGMKPAVVSAWQRLSK